MANILGDAANAQGKDERFNGSWLKGFLGVKNQARWANESMGGGNSTPAGGVTADGNPGSSGPVAPANIVFGGQRAMSRANANYRDQLRIHREEVLDPHHARTQEHLDNETLRGEVRAQGTHLRSEEKLDNAHNRSWLAGQGAPIGANTANLRQKPSTQAAANNRARTTTGTTRAARVSPTLPAGAKSMAAVNRQNSAASTYVDSSASGAAGARRNAAAASYITPSA